VIIFVIHYLGVSILKAECHAPVTAYRHRPDSRPVAGKLVEPKARQVHIFGARSRVKSTENKPKPLCMSGLDPCSAAGLEELGQALVFEASYHPLSVPCNVSGVNTHNDKLRRGEAVGWSAWLLIPAKVKPHKLYYEV